MSIDTWKARVSASLTDPPYSLAARCRRDMNITQPMLQLVRRRARGGHQSMVTRIIPFPQEYLSTISFDRVERRCGVHRRNITLLVSGIRNLCLFDSVKLPPSYILCNLRGIDTSSTGRFLVN